MKKPTPSEQAADLRRIADQIEDGTIAMFSVITLAEKGETPGVENIRAMNDPDIPSDHMLLFVYATLELSKHAIDCLPKEYQRNLSPLLDAAGKHQKKKNKSPKTTH